ncbi:hypothetical protein LSTR_LSTR015578 [Laodelphax striatellus]|uniref:UBC core domain-containing protein n=1 Tax=Laodelphax striatellus TaxID=195883 RepID=A0A482X834_LAOST|nr:hypothetical protein LSTR_LSTR015578 [Laodelphax striatellus]
MENLLITKYLFSSLQTNDTVRYIDISTEFIITQFCDNFSSLRYDNPHKKTENRCGSSEERKHPNRRVSVRDKLLVKEVQEMEQMLPTTCKVKFEDPHCLHEFSLIVSPDEGYWKGGKFVFVS